VKQRKPYDLRKINGKIVNILDKEENLQQVKKNHNFRGGGICLDCMHRIKPPIENGTLSQCRHPKLSYCYTSPHIEIAFHKSSAKVAWAAHEIGIKVKNLSFEIENNAFVFPFSYNHFKIIDCKNFE